MGKRKPEYNAMLENYGASTAYFKPIKDTFFARSKKYPSYLAGIFATKPSMLKCIQ